MKGVFVVRRVGMPVETLATETLGIEARTVEALPTVGTVRVKGDPVKRGARSKKCGLSARWLRMGVIGITND